ncbi:thiamine pyrophosphate-binding protein [Eubacterium ventriosum]|uniref:thiamine pyrophosphate-binding protein n=1 Tax=Eubacterium ventriosum TaxID=39496 RepID=UPI00351FB8F0
MKKRSTEYVVDELVKNGVRTFFGVLGVNVIPLFNAIERGNDRKMISCKTELASAYMADGYSRIKGLGCTITTTGPGVASTVNGVICSYYDSIPVINISAQVNISEYGKYGIQEMTGFGRTPNMIGIMDNITKGAKRVVDKDELCHELKQCISTSVSNRKGPTYLEIDEAILREDDFIDISDNSIDNIEERDAVSIDNLEAIIDNIVEEMTLGSQVAIIIGNGVKGVDYRKLELIAEKLGACVVSTYLGKGLIDNYSKYYLGTIGCYGNHSANSYIEEADVILALGVTFNYLSTAGWSNGLDDKKIIRIDLDEEELERIYDSYLKLKIDALEFVNILFKIVENKEDIKVNRNKFFLEDYDVKEDIDHIFSPLKIIKVVNKYLDEDSVVVADVGQNAYWVERYIKVKGTNNMIVNGGNGSMGYGVAAAVGVRCAQMEQNQSGKVICICGDGGLMMTGNELSTASTYGIDVIWIVFNNGVLGTQEAWCKRNEYSVDCSCSKVNYVEYANSQGVEGISVTSIEEFEDAIKKAIDSKKPYLIDVSFSKEIIPKSYYGKNVKTINR